MIPCTRITNKASICITSTSELLNVNLETSIIRLRFADHAGKDDKVQPHLGIIGKANCIKFSGRREIGQLFGSKQGAALPKLKCRRDGIRSRQEK